MSERIAITGIGIVAAGAVGVDQFRAMLRDGRSAIKRVERFDTSGLSSHCAALVLDFKARDFIAPMKLRRMNALSRYALSAARLAIADCGKDLGPDTGVALGTSFGPVQTSVEYLQEYVAKGAALAPPQLFAESVANAPGSHIAIEWGFRGFNVTVTQRETSTLSAAMYGCSQLMKGTARRAVIGGTEEVNEMVFSVLDRIGALAHATDEAAEASRPFDRRRNGIVIGEGGVAFIAEREGPAAYGYLSGFGMARDPSASISNWGEGAGAVESAMRRAIEDAGITTSDIDAIYASANSSRRGDSVEARAIEGLFGSRIPPVVATKGYFGEYSGGCGLHLAAALVAMRDQTLHATAGFEEADRETGFTPNTEARPADLRHILVNGLASGGGIVAAVVSREPS